MLTRLTRFLANPWLRAGLLMVVLCFCAYGLYAEWPHVASGLTRLHWYTVGLSVLAAMAGTACMMRAWRAVLADLGSPLPVRAAARINFIAQLCKYVPGVVWSVAAQVELGHDYRIPRRRSFASFAVSLAVVVGAGLGLALLTLPFASPAVARHYWPVLAALPLIVAALCPPVLGRLLDLLLRLIRRPPLERRPSWRGLARAVAWDIAGWLLLGLQVWLLLTDIAGLHGRTAMLAIGGYSLAFSAGLLLVVLPSGIGVREVILIATLSRVVPYGPALAVAVVTRVATTFSDLALGALGLALGRRTTQSLATPAAQGGSPQPASLSAISLASERKSDVAPGHSERDPILPNLTAPSG